jgi:CPA1 family monovalent cation:H+ antiporter
MTILQITSLLIVLAGAFGAINYLFLRLPPAIGILVVALFASFAILGFDVFFPSFGVAANVRATVADIDFSDALLEGMLGLLLFAGPYTSKSQTCAANGSWSCSWRRSASDFPRPSWALAFRG